MNSSRGTPPPLPPQRNGRRPRTHPRRRKPRGRVCVSLPTTTISTTTTTTTSTSSSSLQPITRFCHSEEATRPEEPVPGLLANKSSRELLVFLQNASTNVREQVFWGLYMQMFHFFRHHPLPPVPSPWGQLFLPRPSQELLAGMYLCSGSRYQQEFVEVQELGHGGFGRVVRARNKLDGLDYAVKMVVTDQQDNTLEEVILEVQTLAQLDHPRVVRYYTAWLQNAWPLHHSSATAATARVTELSSQFDDDDDGDDDEGNDDGSSGSYSENYPLPPPPPLLGTPGTESDESIIFEDSGEGGREKWHPSLPSLPSIPSIPSMQPKHRRRKNDTRTDGRMLPLQLLTHHPPRPKKVLYIQMKLYGDSLRSWMDERNRRCLAEVVDEADEVRGLWVLRQVVEALGYIHQLGYMHRDVKPANILFSLDGHTVQLGDFGLARLVAHPSGGRAHHPHTPLHTLNVGTPLYTAPEVKDGGGTYGEESDMYSVGILLLELLQPFRTEAQRAQVIGQLKGSGHLHPHLLHRCPLAAQCILQLTDKNPQNRPSAKELLASPLFCPLPLPPLPLLPLPPPPPPPLAASSCSQLKLKSVEKVNCTYFNEEEKLEIEEKVNCCFFNEEEKLKSVEKVNCSFLNEEEKLKSVEKVNCSFFNEEEKLKSEEKVNCSFFNEEEKLKSVEKANCGIFNEEEIVNDGSAIKLNEGAGGKLVNYSSVNEIEERFVNLTLLNEGELVHRTSLNDGRLINETQQRVVNQTVVNDTHGWKTKSEEINESREGTTRRREINETHEQSKRGEINERHEWEMEINGTHERHERTEYERLKRETENGDRTHERSKRREINERHEWDTEINETHELTNRGGINEGHELETEINEPHGWTKRGEINERHEREMEINEAHGWTRRGEINERHERDTEINELHGWTKRGEINERHEREMEINGAHGWTRRGVINERHERDTEFNERHELSKRREINERHEQDTEINEMHEWPKRKEINERHEWNTRRREVNETHELTEYERHKRKSRRREVNEMHEWEGEGQRVSFVKEELTKDEEIAELRQENDALRRQLHALRDALSSMHGQRTKETDS